VRKYKFREKNKEERDLGKDMREGEVEPEGNESYPLSLPPYGKQKEKWG